MTVVEVRELVGYVVEVHNECCHKAVCHWTMHLSSGICVFVTHPEIRCRSETWNPTGGLA